MSRNLNLMLVLREMRDHAFSSNILQIRREADQIQGIKKATVLWKRMFRQVK